MASEPEPDLGDLGGEAVDKLLEDLDARAAICISQWRGADSDVPEVSEAEEPVLAQEQDPRWPDPEHALRYAQWRLAVDASKGRWQMARDFAAWWAHAATVAMVATVENLPVDGIRINAGNPSRRMLPDELDRLSGIYADGAYIVFDDGAANRRREQLWGEDWTEHKLPRLPSAEELSDLLTEYGVRVDRVAEVAQARESVEDALAARKRAMTGKADNEEALFEHAEQLTDLLAEYARVVTALLPVIRPAEEPEP